MRSHYDTLNVAKDASTDEIKKAFRKLSMETHPDVSVDHGGNAEQFKQISEAASILTNERKRRAYDIKLQSTNIFGSTLHRRAAAAARERPPRAARPESGNSSMQMIYRIYRPRNLILGPLAFFATVSAIQYVTGTPEKPRMGHHLEEPSSKLVQAWKNPRTGKWESPAPWDPVYRQLKPTLEYVPRDQVNLRTR